MPTPPTSRVPALILWLVAACQASPALGQATPPVVVYNGPVTTDASEKLVLWIGLADPDAAGHEPAATWQQARDDLGGQSKLETSSVKCVADVWTGVDDIATAQASAFAIVDAVNALVRADTTRFGGISTMADPGVTAGELLQDNTTAGALARVVFEIAFKSFT